MVQHKFKSTLKILHINFNINTDSNKIEKKIVLKMKYQTKSKEASDPGGSVGQTAEAGLI